LLALAGHDSDNALNAVSVTEIEVRRLPVSKGTYGPFSAIIGGFPLWLAQELAELFKASIGHALEQVTQCRHSQEIKVVSPVQKLLAGLFVGVPLSLFIMPEAVPGQDEGQNDLKLGTDRAVE